MKAPHDHHKMLPPARGEQDSTVALVQLELFPGYQYAVNPNAAHFPRRHRRRNPKQADNQPLPTATTGAAADRILALLPALGLGAANVDLVHRNCTWISGNPGRYIKDKVYVVFNTLKASNHEQVVTLANGLLCALEAEDAPPAQPSIPQLIQATLPFFNLCHLEA